MIKSRSDINRYKKNRIVQSVLQIPLYFDWKQYFNAKPNFTLAVDLRGHLHLVSEKVVQNGNNYFEHLELMWGKVNGE